MRPLLDESNAVLCAILEQLIAEDLDVSVREVARRHPTLKNASSFTRNSERMRAIEAARQRQADARRVRLEPIAKRSATMSEALAARTAEVQVLKTQVQALVAATAACIRAVGQAGGMASLERFWSDYKQIADAVQAAGAMPVGGEVIDLSARR